MTGVGWDIMLHPHLPLVHLPTCWLTMLRDFLGEIDGLLHLAQAWAPPLQCQGDTYLMEQFKA